MQNASVTTLDLSVPRSELHDKLNLSACEISCNNLPAGVQIPFVHMHKENEEVYIVISGSGEFYIDGEIVPLKPGSALRIAPAGRRSLKAGTEGLRYLCIQAKAGSLKQFTLSDGVIEETKAFPEA